MQRRRLFRCFAEPFVFGPLEGAQEHGEIIYAFLVPVTEDIKSPLIPEQVQYEYLLGSIVKRKKFKLFGYLLFETLDTARDYVTKKV